MEEDIKNLKEIIDLCNEELNNKDENITAVLDLTDLLSLRNLIKAYKELEEENKTLKNVVSEIFNSEDITDDYIPISLVEEKIEELNRKIKYEDNEKVIIWLHKQRKILQELLEKRK